MKKHIVVMVACVALLLWLWPNLVHEPLHLLALEVQGASGVITFDWSWPPAPYIDKVGDVAGVAGGLLYVLLPSVVSVVLLALLYVTRHKATVVTHLAPAVYLAFDLIMNIMKYRSPTSDFYFLTTIPHTAVLSFLLCLSGVSVVVVARILPYALPQPKEQVGEE